MGPLAVSPYRKDASWFVSRTGTSVSLELCGGASRQVNEELR